MYFQIVLVWTNEGTQFFLARHLERVSINTKVPLLYNWLMKFQDNCMHASCLLGLKTHYCNKFHKVNDNSLISWYVYTP